MSLVARDDDGVDPTSDQSNTERQEIREGCKGVRCTRSCAPAIPGTPIAGGMKS